VSPMRHANRTRYLRKAVRVRCGTAAGSAAPSFDRPRNPQLLATIVRSRAAKIRKLLERREATKFKQIAHLLPHGPAQGPRGLLSPRRMRVVLLKAKRLLHNLALPLDVTRDHGSADTVAGAWVLHLADQHGFEIRSQHVRNWGQIDR
jgi:hypothetical protein